MTAGYFVVRQDEKVGINKSKGTFVDKNANYTYTMVVSKLSITTAFPMKKESVIVILFIKKKLKNLKSVAQNPATVKQQKNHKEKEETN